MKKDIERLKPIFDGLENVRGAIRDVPDFQERQFSPYDELTGTMQTPFGYAGEMEDQNGLVYLRARYYNRNTGTFLSIDPFEGNINNPMSLNGYAYAYGNPVNLVDPSGMYGERPEAWSNCNSPASDCCAKYASEPANHAACMLNPDTWCDLAGDTRCKSIQDYANQLVTSGRYSGREVLSRTVEYAFQKYHYSTARELSDDVSCAVTGTRGPNTILDASNIGVGLGYNGKRFSLGMGGWSADYEDNTDTQAFHVWSYVNTVAQGGDLGVVLSAIANPYHECWDIQDAGRSIPDYKLAWAGIILGYSIYNNHYSPDEISGWIDTWLGGKQSYEDLLNSQDADWLKKYSTGSIPALCPFVNTH